MKATAAILFAILTATPALAEDHARCYGSLCPMCEVTTGGTAIDPVRELVSCASVDRVCYGGPRFGGPRCAWRLKSTIAWEAMQEGARKLQAPYGCMQGEPASLCMGPIP